MNLVRGNLHYLQSWLKRDVNRGSTDAHCPVSYSYDAVDTYTIKWDTFISRPLYIVDSYPRRVGLSTGGRALKDTNIHAWRDDL